jgi:uncharacterized membrane protein
VFKEILDNIVNILNTNRGKTIGGIIGFLIGIFILTVGFFKTLFIVLCICIGCYLGGKTDKMEALKHFLDKFLPQGKNKQ